ncbi:hypothetical protein ACFQZC_00685 [Streptacidiphilus monticola]
MDSWALTQTLPVTGDGNATLWLSSIQRTGSDTLGGGSPSSVTLPPVTFTGSDLMNRVDTTHDGLPPMYRFRIGSITSETGSVTTVTYQLTNPCSAPVTITPSANTSSCYPVSWTPQGYTAPITDWFNKWAVVQVTQSDPTGGALQTSTSYTYSGPAWHYDDNEVVKAKYRLYGQWRGYKDVVTLTGDGVNDKQTKSETLYYQGMSKDNNTTAVNVTDSQSGNHEDLNQLAGNPLEATTWQGNGGGVDHSTITSYWVSPATATRTRTGLPDLTANIVAPVETWSRQATTDTGTTTWRYTETDTTYDTTTTDATYGLETTSYTHTVPANSAYDRCATTTYAKANTTANLVGLAASSEIDAVACGGFTEGSPASVPATAAVNTLTAPASVTRPDQVVSATRTFYDDATHAATWPQPVLTFPQTTAPTKGEVSIVQKATGYSGGAFTWQTSAATVYDSVGRPSDAYAPSPGDNTASPAGAKTHTVYAVDTAGNVTGTTVTNPLNQSVTTTVDPARGTTLTTSDANNVVTTSQYDGLGRVTSVWLASRYTTTSPRRRTTPTPTRSPTTASPLSPPTSSTTSRPGRPPPLSTTHCCGCGRPRRRPRRAAAWSPTPSTTRAAGSRTPTTAGGTPPPPPTPPWPPPTTSTTRSPTRTTTPTTAWAASSSTSRRTTAPRSPAPPPSTTATAPPSSRPPAAPPRPPSPTPSAAPPNWTTTPPPPPCTPPPTPSPASSPSPAAPPKPPPTATTTTATRTPSPPADPPGPPPTTSSARSPAKTTPTPAPPRCCTTRPGS